MIKVNIMLHNFVFMLMLDVHRDRLDFQVYMQYLILMVCFYNLLSFCYAYLILLQIMIQTNIRLKLLWCVSNTNTRV